MAMNQFQNRMKELLDNEPSGELSSRLNEKGVECAIIVPLLEYQLGYNSLLDVQYELSSENRNGQRFDFVVDDKLLVEAKSLGTNLDTKIEKQIKDYIEYNEKTNYGILTNGWEYIFYIKKEYIEKRINDEKPIGQNIESVIKVLSVQISDERFLDIISLFKKENIDDNVLKIGKYVLNNIQPVQGRSAKISSDKGLDSYIKRLIDNVTTIVRGYYFEKVKTGELEKGTRITYTTRELEIGVIVQNDGTVILPKDGIQIRDMPKVMDQYKELMKLYVNQWSQQETQFDSPYDIVLQGLGRKNKITGIEKLYPFA